jgi:hypothetical protein
MATDYILFIHGVNTRFDREQPTYADKLFDLIQQRVGSSLNLKKIVLYWGDVNKKAEKDLLNAFRSSPDWSKFWFREFRENQLLQFVGDAALYISSHVGYLAVEQLKDQALAGLRGFQAGDRLHLVTHSWGTVIAFDILFASRWNLPNVPGGEDVQALRDCLFGLEPHPHQGVRLASIHTMGSPIALFSLMSVSGDSTHDLTPLLKQLLQHLHEVMDGKKLPWRNFAHPGDPVAWPLATVMPTLLEESSHYVDIKDEITHNAELSDFVTEPVSQTVLALVHGGDAHGSYWNSKEVAQEIADTIKKAVG